MPRSKNPNPKQMTNNDKDNSSISASRSPSDMEETEKPDIEPSLSPPSIASFETEQTDAVGVEIRSKDGSDCCGGDANASQSDRLHSEEIASAHFFASDLPNDNRERRSAISPDLEPVEGNKGRRPSLGLLNPNILPWLRKRFVLKEDARTSASQVIKLYENDFESELNAPLRNYQVGQLLRRIFPNIQRCKITVNGKRVWVYKHLCIVSADDDTSSTKVESNNDNLMSYSNEQDNADDNGKDFTNLSNNDASLSAKKRHSLAMMPKNVRRHVKNSAILYNLLYPHRGMTSKALYSERGGLFHTDRIDDCDAPDKFIKTDVDASDNIKKNLQREGNIIQWLRDNYEYADGYYVKSLDVLRKYNQGRETWIKYLSQVGRVIKHVFPRARHLRRSLKGGKREWVYHNIRPKEHSEMDVWRGSTKNLTRDAAFGAFNIRPSMVSFPHFALEKVACLGQDEITLHHQNDPEENLEPSRLPHEDGNRLPGKPESVRSDGSSPFDIGPGSSHSRKESSSTPNSSVNFNPLFYKSESEGSSRDRDTPSVDAGAPWWVPNEPNFAGLHAEQISDVKVACSPLKPHPDNRNQAINVPKRRSHLESQIDRLKSEKKTTSCSNTNDACHLEQDQTDLPVTPEAENEAEDLSMASSGRSDNKRTYAESIKDDQTLNLSVTDKRQATGNGFSEVNQAGDFVLDQQESCLPIVDHNYSFAHVVDSELRIKEFTKAKQAKSNTRGDAVECDSANRIDDGGIRGNNNPVANPVGEFIRWEDLSMCGAHRYGWSLTPTLNHDIPCGYIEWILFEGQALRDGQRVFRELKIYDDWSVSIHVMGKKVYPDDLGGITDLQRTRDSVAKVFRTLASTRSCRGLPALCLSDLCVHGVVVAKSEIWSAREDECEELRHRAINCQILYRGNEEACAKCIRVVRMHAQNVASASGNNGFTEKGGSRFAPRPNSSF